MGSGSVKARKTREGSWGVKGKNNRNSHLRQCSEMHFTKGEVDTSKFGKEGRIRDNFQSEG